MQEHPPLAQPDGSGDGDAYHAFFDAFYRGAFDAGLPAASSHAGQLLGPTRRAGGRGHPVLVVARPLRRR